MYMVDISYQRTQVNEAWSNDGLVVECTNTAYAMIAMYASMYSTIGPELPLKDNVIPNVT